jgi:tripartite ATP-independent transporter DctP family solute receptor
MATLLTRRRLLVTAGAATLGVVSRTRAASSVTMKVAYATGTNFYHHLGAETFKQALESSTGGRISVELYATGQLGGESQILEGLKVGTIEAYIGTCGALSNFVPELGLVDLPYLWRDNAQAFGALDGPIGAKLAQAAPAKGFTLLGYWPAGRRDVYGNVKIEKPDDFHGVKIRTLQAPVFLATFKAFGALPTPLAWPETYSALQQGVIDASETALPAMLDANQQEVVKYVSLTGHALTIATITVATRWYTDLEPDLRQAIAEAEAKGRARVLAADEQAFENAITRLKVAGKVILSPDPAPFRTLVRQTIYPQFSDRFDPKVIKEITDS